jgi:hypothetical protein
LVLALAKLHNYCIDAQDDSRNVLLTASNEWVTEINGGVPLVPVAADFQSGNDVVPGQLLHGGYHFDNIGGAVGPRKRQQRYEYNSEADGVPLPREALHSYIESIGVIMRPIPRPLRQ